MDYPRFRWTAGALLVAGCSILASPVAAQQLTMVPGKTDLEQEYAIQLDSNGPICPVVSGSSNPAEADLGNVCTDLITNAAFVNTGSGSSTLGLNADGINEALRTLSNSQNPAYANSSVQVTAIGSAVTNRLHALRQGADGIMFAGTLIDGAGNPVAVQYDLLREDSAAGDGDVLGPLGVFLNFVGGFGHRKTTSSELGYDYRELSGIIGADYRFLDWLVAGAAFEYSNVERDFNHNGGDLDSDTYAGSIYASVQPGDFYLDTIFTYGESDVDSKRRIRFGVPNSPGAIRRTAKGDTGTDEWTFAGVTGYNFHFGSLIAGPFMQGEWDRVEVDAFNESGAFGLDLHHNDDVRTSGTFGLGAQASYQISTSFGVVIPQLLMNWEHEFADDRRNITVRFRNDPTNSGLTLRTSKPIRDYADLSASVVGSFQGGWSGFIDYETVLFHKRLSAHTFTAGVRKMF